MYVLYTTDVRYVYYQIILAFLTDSRTQIPRIRAGYLFGFYEYSE